MQIRLANIADLSVIQQINQQFKHEYSHPDDFLEQQIAAGQILLAEIDERVVGYLLYQILWGNTPFLALLKVVPEYQQRGVATSLLVKLKVILKELEFTNLLSSTEVVNQKGLQWHKSQSFCEVGQLELIYGQEQFYLLKL